jgi:hypothetical protein
MVAFGAFAYFLVIPALLFQMFPVFEKFSRGADSTINEGFARGVLSRGYAFVVGLVGSLVAMVTCAVGWAVASLESAVLSQERLGETGIAVAMVSILMGVVTVIAACPWLGQQLLIGQCRARDPGARQSWTWPLAPIAMALAWAATVGWLGYRIANATSVMTARLDYRVLPASDEVLQQWLRSQPGIAAATVSREGNTVVVECGLCPYRSHTFSWWIGTVMFDYTTPGGEKRSVHLSRVAADAGYKGLTKATFDRPRSQW